MPFERDVGFQVDTLNLTTASRPDSGVSVSVSPIAQTESGTTTEETDTILQQQQKNQQQQQQSRIRTSSSGSSEEAIPKPLLPTSSGAKKRRSKRAKKSETRALPIAIKDSKAILQEELDDELNDFFSKLIALERMVEDQETELEEMVSLIHNRNHWGNPKK